MSTIICPKCRQYVIQFEVAQLNELVLFETDPVLVLINAGREVTTGCKPHSCEKLGVTVDRTKYIPIEEVKITCKYCEEEVHAVGSTFSVEDGWRCSLCIKDRAEQEEKRRKQAGHR